MRWLMESRDISYVNVRADVTDVWKCPRPYNGVDTLDLTPKCHFMNRFQVILYDQMGVYLFDVIPKCESGGI